QQPKPVLLDVGEITIPYPWSPNIVDVQTLRVGQLLLIVGSPESTTMAGRRWREAVASASGSLTDEEPIVVLGGPANTYSVS
ncbi:neutral/alkaline non-lysosomal ceramidase N-terminal domain-containing protein, partial [Staphylococcus aureus]